MNYLFNVKKDLLEKTADFYLKSGNVNTYTFSLDTDETWDGYIKFAIFIKNGIAYNVEIINNELAVPQKVLLTPGEVSFGICGTATEDDFSRISTNLISFTVLQGAYKEADTPKAPEPDMWETLFSNSVPKIIDKTWHVYDVVSKTYTDTGILAEAETPIKGVDYYTEQEKEEMISAVLEKIPNGDEVSY